MLEAHILLVLQRHCECPIYRSKLLWFCSNYSLMLQTFCYLVVVFFVLVIMSFDLRLMQCWSLQLICAYGKLFCKHSEIDVWYVYNVRYNYQAVLTVYSKGMRCHSFVQEKDYVGWILIQKKV